MARESKVKMGSDIGVGDRVVFAEEGYEPTGYKPGTLHTVMAIMAFGVGDVVEVYAATLSSGGSWPVSALRKVLLASGLEPK